MRAAQEGRPVVEQVDRLHRNDAQGKRARRCGTRTRRRRSATTGQPAGRALSAAAQLRVALERVDRVAGPRQAQCDPAGSGADVEDRAAGGGRELEPEREVGGVGAALDVVPDDPGGAHASAHELAAAPRLTSRVRSSSIAV